MCIRDRFGRVLEEFPVQAETIKVLEQLKKTGLLIQEDKMLKLTEKGQLFYDTVAEEII